MTQKKHKVAEQSASDAHTYTHTHTHTRTHHITPFLGYHIQVDQIQNSPDHIHSIHCFDENIVYTLTLTHLKVQIVSRRISFTVVVITFPIGK